MTVINECSHCGKPIVGDAVLSRSDVYGEAPCCSAACAEEQERVSYFPDVPETTEEVQS